ncbi:MAG: hypothetical protein HY447_04205 [Candidatus Omnitrophica bacterium]|nr:hypothetical protein [Candidatus Omnitrophota bacterium]
MSILVIKHVPHEGLGLLESIFEEEGVSYRYLNAYETPFPSFDLSKASALVVLGGPMGVYEADKYPFLTRVIEILKESMRQKIPTLGICLGSQLLASAGGARVFKGPRKEIGWFPIQAKSVARKDPLLRHCLSEAMVFHWHGDTFDLPRGSVHLASSERYPHQAFRIGDSAWGFQFHLEMTEAMIKDWVEIAEEKSKNPSPDWNACEILTQTPCFLPEMETLARKVFGEFASLAKRAVTR